MASGDPDKPLDFKPINEGLGFHPFADGLPYAPRSKKSATPRPRAAPLAERVGALRPVNSLTGAGATAAGRPQFTYPASPPAVAARVTVPLARQAQAPASSLASTLPASAEYTPAPAASASYTLPPLDNGLRPQPLNGITQGFGHGFGMIYLAKRALAYVIDSALNVAVCIGALYVALWRQNIELEMLFNPGVVLIAGLFLAFFSWALVTAQEVVFGTSIGKRLFGLTLQGSATVVFLRSFFFLSSIGFVGAGLVWAIFDRRRRCWHDLVTDLQPQEVARL